MPNYIDCTAALQTTRCVLVLLLLDYCSIFILSNACNSWRFAINSWRRHGFTSSRDPTQLFATWRGPKIVLLAPDVGHRLALVNLAHQIWGLLCGATHGKVYRNNQSDHHNSSSRWSRQCRRPWKRCRGRHLVVLDANCGSLRTDVYNAGKTTLSLYELVQV